MEVELQAALEAARGAGQIILDAYQRFVAIPNARADISTEADRQSQEAILSHLHKRFPTDALCAEEQTPTLADAVHTGARLWIVDPIDGTRGFAQKNGEFSVMIAFVQDGAIGVGVVLEPAVRRLTYAVRDGGCWRQDDDMTQPTRCAVSTTNQLGAATLAQSHSKPGATSDPVRVLRPKLVRETYSAGVKLALVARGDASICTSTRISHFPTGIFVPGTFSSQKRARPRVGRLRGQELRYGLPGAHQRHGLLATNGVLHDASLAGMRLIG